MFKIVITGVECSGKSTLAQEIGKELGAPVLPEYAREYLAGLGRAYTIEDLNIIAREQARREEEMHREDLVICDTSFLVLYIWSNVKYGKVSPFIEDLLDRSAADLYLLPFWNIPYEEDPLREHPHEREGLYALYQRELEKREFQWRTVHGEKRDRLHQALSIITPLIPTKS